MTKEEKTMPETHRNSKEIKVWLLRKGVNITEIARIAGVERTNVSKTIAGTRNNRKALQWLVSEGCPKRYLALPEDMQRRNSGK